MNKLSLNLGTGNHTVYLEKFITTRYESRLRVRNIGVFWNFKNVLEGANNSIYTVTGGVNINPITFGEGYWTFNMISEKLGESNIKLERNRYNNTYKIHSPKQLNLLNFGPLLGFPVNTVIQANTWTNSPSSVDINLGLRYVTVSCNCVDADRNFDTTGKRSKVIYSFNPRTLGAKLKFVRNLLR